MRKELTSIVSLALSLRLLIRILTLPLRTDKQSVLEVGRCITISMLLSLIRRQGHWSIRMLVVA
jgi:hypothetical protein